VKSKRLNEIETYLHHTAIDLLLKAYRELALDAHGNRDRDPYSYFNTEMRGLDTAAKRLGLTGIEPREAGYYDE